MTTDPGRARPPRRHTDADGPWWDPPDLTGIPNVDPGALRKWRMRATGDGTIQARHRDGYAADVTMGPGADDPLQLLIALCDIAARRAMMRERERRGVRRMVEP